MKTLIRMLSSVSVYLVASFVTVQTVSAAGLMTPKSSNLNALSIKEHHVNVVIEDGYAITRVDQVFYNSHDTHLEAVYSFPVPEKASVGEFTYWIDGKPVTGEVLEKKKAREVYEQEKAQGRETALTEQDDYKAFESSVYPVRPKQDVKIRLVYIQPVHVDLGIGSYVYPLEEGGVDEEKLAFWSYNDAVTEAFSFNVDLRSSYPVDGVRLPKHPQAVVTPKQGQTTTVQEWSIALANGQSNVAEEGAATATQSAQKTQAVQNLNQDIVVYWRHQQGLPGTIDMITHKESKNGRGTFMMTVTPGDDLSAINQGRDWVFVLDLSGSMQGKYQSLIEGVKKGLAKLNPNDRFRVILFNNASRELTPGYINATPEHVLKYTQQLENTQPTGGTNLYAGLENGIRGLDSDRASAIILVTDGVANVGITEKKQFLKLLERYDVRLFTFVMGNSANRPLLDGMTKVSNGFAMSVSNSDDIVGKLLLATDKLTHEAFHDIDVKVDGVKVKDMTPDRIGSLYRGQQLIVFGHYWGDGEAEVTISGKVSGQKKSYQTTFDFPETSTLNPEVERLWAFATIEDLQNKIDYLGEDADSKQAIVDLAKEYGLVTPYTSMVIVREEVFAQHNIERNNAKRVAQEHQAQQQRAASGVRSNRVDTAKPAFQTTRSYPGSSGGSGGGAFGPVLILILGVLFLVRRKTKVE
ncbi:VIT and VWA domain-containing protein [Litoribacillus peritrichatus]|uniref:VWA domain-containing protein n=1 Tax=Litoribacillus peritrichatus TaxID=718191 RepID=A0ABP7MTZ0_9GAMM